MLIINFKTYKEDIGDKGVSLAREIEEVAKRYKTPVVLSPSTVDAKEIMHSVNLPVWVQHVDVYSEGQSTGWLPPENAKTEGFAGTLLNHSEHKLEKHVLEETVRKCKSVKLPVLIFAASQEEATEVAKLSPEFVSYEPPELIASKESSVAQSRPETIRKVVEAIPNIPVLVGAGIKSTEDVKVSLQMGAKGIVLSSAIVLAEDPKAKVDELLKGFE